MCHNFGTALEGFTWKGRSTGGQRDREIKWDIRPNLVMMSSFSVRKSFVVFSAGLNSAKFVPLEYNVY
jgi:hypothetical protein